MCISYPITVMYSVTLGEGSMSFRWRMSNGNPIVAPLAVYDNDGFRMGGRFIYLFDLFICLFLF
jgi:hypothetical protein